CTLLGSYIDELNVFLAYGEVQNIVVIVHFTKSNASKVIMRYNDLRMMYKKIHTQNCINSTKLTFNPECEEAVKQI
ncbi:hypothetical protein CR513_36073, partial [Mucuna pruriens]